MTFAITFDELSEIANTYLKESASEEMDIETLPLSNGILINIKKFDTGSITLSGKLELHYESYEAGVLTIRLKFRNFFFDLVKKLLMGVVIKIMMKKFRQQDDTEEVDPTKFIHFRSNTISAEVNNLLEAMKVPVELVLIRHKEGSIAVAFNFRPDRLQEDAVALEQ